MSERLDDRDVVERALDELRRGGVRLGEIFLRRSESTSVEVSNGIVESTVLHGERGVGVRVLDGGRVGFAWTGDLSPAGIAECVELARANARVTGVDEALALSDAPVDADGDLDIHEPEGAGKPVSDKLAVAFAIETAAKLEDARVRTFRKTTYGDSDGVTYFATTTGAFGSYRETFYGAGTAAMAADDGDKQIGYFGDASRRFEGVDPIAIGAEAARRAVLKLGAREFATQRIDLILEPYLAAAFLGVLAPLFFADNVLKGKSLLAGKVGQEIASAELTIRDEARRPGGLRTVPFDGEGTPTRDLALVERGRLVGYLQSIKTASKMGLPRTGNARRGSYASVPAIGASNLSIAPGTRAPEELAASADRALAITSLLNLHTVDPISGDFSLGATATYLEKGAPQHPVKGIAIAGNLVDFLKAIAAVGNDFRTSSSGIGSPTLLVRGISVGGA